MPESLVLVTVIVGFGLLIVAGARLGAGSHLSLAGLFPAQSGNDWPRGVQEPDVPRFAVAHADTLRRDPTPASEATKARHATAADPAAEAFHPAEIIELYDRPIVPGR